MRSLSISVLGGTGFVGSRLVSRLIRDGHRVRVLTRNRDRHRELLVLPGLELINADVHHPSVLVEAVRGCDVVINLVGILNERGRSGAGFTRAHADLARKVVAACRSGGVGRLLQMSSLRAGENAPSHYLRSKGVAERVVREESGPVVWTLFEPSVIFGPGDGFMNLFATLLRLFPIVPLARSGTRFAPVFVGDVVEAMARSLEDHSTHRATLQLCGPEVLTLAEVVRYVAAVLGRRRVIVGLPDALGWLQALVLDFVPGKPMSLDNFRSLELDSVCSEDGLARLGIVPTSLRAVVPGYLGARQREARLATYRRAAGTRVGWP
ncbi:MAG TPA: complex I NDUFA9 subunit family protein [Steroidobacteraceae bacterium]|nr:complex I NDUFA9 subunit family protein [Steroidobacteraceae bacterium]